MKGEENRGGAEQNREKRLDRSEASKIEVRHYLKSFTLGAILARVYT